MPTQPDREATDVEAQLHVLLTDNQRRLERLATRNVGVTMESQIRLRLTALVEFLIGTDGEPERAEFELAFQRLMADALAKLEFEVNTKIAPPNGHRGDGLVLP